MANRKNFQWYLYKEISGIIYYYFVDGAGDVQLTTTKTPLMFAPKGWRNQTLKWGRGFVYHAIFQTFTEPLKFVKDGAKIMRLLYTLYGTEPECTLRIERFNRTLAVWDYEEYYIGEIDFSRYYKEKDFVNSEVMEGGFMAKLKAKENTNFEIAVTDSPSRIWLNMDGIFVLAIFNFTGMEQPVDNTPPTFVASSRENFPTLLWYKTEGYSNGDNNPKGNEHIGPNASMFQQNYLGLPDMITLASANKWFLRNVSSSISYDYTVNISLVIDHKNLTATSKHMNLFLYKNAGSAVGTAVTKYALGSGGNIPGLGTLTDTISISFNITLAPDDQIWFWFRHTGVAGDVEYHLQKCDINVSVPNRIKQSFVPARWAFDVGTELFANIDPTVTFESTLLETTKKRFALTCGDALRNLLQSTMKTNITDYYKSVDAINCVCLDFDKPNNIVSIMPRAHAYDEATQIADLGEVSKFKHYPLTSEMFAKFIAGFRDIKYDEVNGKDEPNINYEYQSNLIRVTNEKNIRSEYRSDMYGMELLRGNLEGKLQADSESDNDIFWADIDTTPAGTVPAGLPGAGENYYNLQRSGYTVLQGLFSPSTAYNLYLIPPLTIREHGPYINSVLYPQMDISGSKLKFQVNSKTQNNNVELVIDFGGTVINTKSDIALVDMGDPLFYPIVLEFDCLLPQNILAIMQSNPRGKIKVLSKGLAYYGFLYDVDNEPVMKPKQTYKLICSKSTDLSNFVNQS